MSVDTAPLKPNFVGTIKDPVNLAIMDVDAFIHKNNVMEVTSTLPFEPSTNLYNRDGLYSEEIFGYVGSPERMLRFGYIELNTPLFHPKVFKIICQLGGLYKDIMSGAAYAVFDPVAKDFKRVVGTPPAEAGTGFSFFLSYFHDIVFRKSSSSKRDERIEVIEQYKDRVITTRFLIEPAGLRDISNDSSGRLIQDDINKLYVSTMLYARSIPKGSKSTAYDSVRYLLQSKINEIYGYIENFLDGKYGFIQGNFARRKIALGTRNVITAATLTALSPEDPQLLKADDVMVGVYQTMKGLQPYTKYLWNTLLVTPIFKTDAVTHLALTDPKTFKLVYTSISPTTRDAFTSSEGVDKIINSFSNEDLRGKPILITDLQGVSYAALLVYDDGDEIALCRSIDDLEKRWPRKIDKAKLRPITYIELFYIITEIASMGKHALITRYPVIEQGSVYPAKIHVISTTPSRSVKLIDLLSGFYDETLLRQYPVLGSTYMDAAMVHPSRLAALGGD